LHVLSKKLIAYEIQVNEADASQLNKYKLKLPILVNENRQIILCTHDINTNLVAHKTC